MVRIKMKYYMDKHFAIIHIKVWVYVYGQYSAFQWKAILYKSSYQQYSHVVVMNIVTDLC